MADPEAMDGFLEETFKKEGLNVEELKSQSKESVNKKALLEATEPKKKNRRKK